MEKLQELQNLIVNNKSTLDRLANHSRLTNDDRNAILHFYARVADYVATNRIQEHFRNIPA